MSTSDKYSIEKITDVRPWTDNLFSFRTTRDRGYRFVPGQFARLGVKSPDAGDIVFGLQEICDGLGPAVVDRFVRKCKRP